MDGRNLSEEEKVEVGQHFVFGFHGYEASDEVVRLIRDFKVGSIILMKRNVQSYKQVRELVHSLQMTAKEAGHKTPLLIGIDQENGLVSAFSNMNGEAGTQFPGAMTVAATRDLEAAENLYQATARELKLAGINWAYSPDADVNSDPRNPVIGVRSFGEDPILASDFANAAAKGLSSGGVAACAKHFPGHGDTHVDSHLALPVIHKTLNELEKTELVPFRSLISNGVDSIMMGHMALPSLKVPPSDESGEGPASLSRIATHKLLRDHLGFEGLIVTDCLEMNAISDTNQGGPGAERGAVLALGAGADVVMICHTFDWHVGAVKAVYAALSSGELAIEDLRVSGERVAKLKARYAGNWEDIDEAYGRVTDTEWSSSKDANRVLSSRAYAAAMTWLRPEDLVDPLKAIGREGSASSEQRASIKNRPLNVDKTVVIFTPARERINLAVDDSFIEDGNLEGILLASNGAVRNTAGESYLAFGRAVTQKAGNVRGHFVFSTSDYASASIAKEGVDAVIICLRNAHLPSSAWQVAFLSKVLEEVGKDVRVVVLMTCGPYDLSGRDEETKSVVKSLKERNEHVLCTFEFTKEALVAAVDAIFE